MFYYYQIRNHHYKTEKLPLILCPLCRTAGGMNMSIQQKYYWMIGPMSPSAKYAIAWCEHCGNYIPKVKWTDEMDAFYVNLKRDLTTPRRLYRGLWVMPLLIITFIGIIFLVINLTDSRQKSNAVAVKEAILHPHPGDIFQVIHSGGGTATYTYFKVDHSDGDDLYLLPSSVQKPDMNGWDDVPTEKGAYTGQPLLVSIARSGADDMFSYGADNHDYGIVYGVWKDGQLTKKY